MELRMSFKIFEHEKALSTSTATLIIEAISIIGAAAIGIMLGSFTDKVVTHVVISV